MKFLVFLGLLIVATTATAPPPKPILQSVYAVGTHYEVGFAVGQSIRNDIQFFYKNDSYLNTVIFPFYETAEGKALYKKYYEVNSAQYPELVDELRGLCDGADVPFHYGFLNMIRFELWLMFLNKEGGKPRDEQCSDILLNNGDQYYLGHNEDGPVDARQGGVLIQAQVLDNNGNHLYAYTGYAYPGTLAGMAFGFNDNGVCYSTNEVFPKEMIVGGLARYFINRDLLRSTSPEDVIARASVKNGACGFSFNVASTRRNIMFNGETGPNGRLDVLHVKNGVYNHYNEYKHLNQTFNPDASTEHRQARYNEFPPIKTAANILQFLGDTKDPEYPLYRNNTYPDDSVTLATALFDLNAKRISIWRTNPKNTLPVAELPLY
eukprot:GCRY01000279.1.p1 GENE.GCRY01000279.1~~GCRY01000279.1.p1  ORF type:complete len:378 (+),score=75.18 GCRY01000279.1:60-1193(+)